MLEVEGGRGVGGRDMREVEVLEVGHEGGRGVGGRCMRGVEVLEVGA